MANFGAFFNKYLNLTLIFVKIFTTFFYEIFVDNGLTAASVGPS